MSITCERPLPTQTAKSGFFSRVFGIATGLKDSLNISRDPLAYFVKRMLKHPEYSVYYIGGQRVMMITDPVALRHVMVENNRNFTKGTFYQSMRSILGGGLLMTEAGEWLQQRRHTAPHFTGQALKSFSQNMIDSIAENLDALQKQVEQGEIIVNANHEMMHITLSNIMRTLFSTKLTRDEHTELYNAFASILKASENRIWSFIKKPLALDERYNPLYRKAIPTLVKFADKLIAQRRAQSLPPQDLLTDLIADCDQRQLDHKFLRDQVITLIVTGFEAPSVALSWVHYILARNPEIERRIHAEVKSVLGERPPTLEDVENLKYTRAVLDETLRLYPPLWTVSRTALVDDWLPFGSGATGYVPKGTHVMICPYAIHRHPALWDNPEAFDPERFMGKSRADVAPYSYLPFGGGPRNCLGDRYALLELTLIIAMTVQRFQLQLLPGQAIKPVAITTLRNETPIQFKLAVRPASSAFTPAVSSHADESRMTVCPFKHYQNAEETV